MSRPPLEIAIFRFPLNRGWGWQIREEHKPTEIWDEFRDAHATIATCADEAECALDRVMTKIYLKDKGLPEDTELDVPIHEIY